MKKTVFIIDDDPIFRLIAEKMLIKIDSNLLILQCENGNIGLEKLTIHQEASIHNIILLDLNMPVLDGWGFLDKIQSTSLTDFQSMKLYIISSSTDKGDIDKAKQYSFVKKFYHKPLSFVDINEILTL